MPKLGESVHEGTVEAWLVEPGSKVNEYDPLCEILTDKVTAEVPSSFEGVIEKILVDVGETIEVGTPICEIKVSNKVHEKEPEQKSQPQTNKKDNNSTDTQKEIKRISPVVMRLASEHNVNLDDVEGTGQFGRVTKKDILSYIDNLVKNEAPKTDKPSTDIKTTSDSSRLELTGVKKAIANNMVKSKTEIPHAWMMIEVDATELVHLRNKYKDAFKSEGIKLTYFAFFIEAVAKALNTNKILNSSWQGDSIQIHDSINLNIAVSADDDLYVPVIHNADMLSIRGIAKKLAQLAEKGRTHALTSEDMHGGTFTINNTGAFGSIQSQGVINHPQAAILQVESIVKKPVFIDEMLAARYMVNLCLSIDHRVLNGVDAGKFLQDVKKNIESIDSETTL